MSNYTAAVKERQEEVRSIKQLNKTLYSVIWSQCSEAMRDRVEHADNFQRINAESDGLGLLQVIKNVAYNYVSTEYKVGSIIDALIQLVTLL
jgi:hypothetical protein